MRERDSFRKALDSWMLMRKTTSHFHLIWTRHDVFELAYGNVQRRIWRLLMVKSWSPRPLILCFLIKTTQLELKRNSREFKGKSKGCQSKLKRMSRGAQGYSRELKARALRLPLLGERQKIRKVIGGNFENLSGNLSHCFIADVSYLRFTVNSSSCKMALCLGSLSIHHGALLQRFPSLGSLSIHLAALLQKSTF